MSPKPKTISYTVESTKWGEFPTDMLRRDSASPASPDDATMIERLSAWSDKSDLPDRVQVHLTAPATRGVPLVGRWESFGWKVIECSDPSVILDTTAMHADDLRVKLTRKIADGVVRLRGSIHMAGPAYDAISYASEVAARDPEHRQRSIGHCEGVLFVLETGYVMSLMGGEDVSVLVAALAMTREVLECQDHAVRTLYISDAPTALFGRLSALARKFGAA